MRFESQAHGRMSHNVVTRNTVLAFTCFLFLVLKNARSDRSTEQLEIEMMRAQIVPDVLRLAPRYELKLKYGNKVVNFGDKLTPFEINVQPSSLYWPTKANKLYTLIFIDPDVPSRQNPDEREWMHWIVANIPKTHINRGDVLAQYIGGIPSHLGTWHRYVYVVFEQNAKEEFKDWMHKDSRPIKRYRAKFSTLHFVSKYNLGEAIAVNYFMSSNLTLTTTTELTPTPNITIG